VPDDPLQAFVLNQIANGGWGFCAGDPTEGLNLTGTAD
jgi:hypothetical protein